MGKDLKLTMLGAGSGFVLTIAKELLTDPVFENCRLTLMDVSQERLDAADQAVSEVLAKGKNHAVGDFVSDLYGSKVNALVFNFHEGFAGIFV